MFTQSVMPGANGSSKGKQINRHEYNILPAKKWFIFALSYGITYLIYIR